MMELVVPTPVVYAGRNQIHEYCVRCHAGQPSPSDTPIKDLPDEVFDDYGRPATEKERPFYRPERREQENPLRKDQGDDIASIVGSVEALF